MTNEIWLKRQHPNVIQMTEKNKDHRRRDLVFSVGSLLHAKPHYCTVVITAKCKKANPWARWNTTKCHRWDPRSSTLELIGFHDPRVYVVSLSVIKKRYVLVGDAFGSVQVSLLTEGGCAYLPVGVCSLSVEERLENYFSSSIFFSCCWCWCWCCWCCYFPISNWWCGVRKGAS